MFNFLAGLFAPALKIADKLVMDKDKYAELEFKKAENEHDARMALLQVTTTPNIDAFVKLMMAFRDVIIPMFRPVGSIAMAAFGAYAVQNGLDISEPVQIALFGAPLAWGASRHAEKKK